MQVPDNEMTQRLYEVLAKLDNADDVRKFFEDACTIKEILEIAQRLETAVLLDEGKSYKDISSMTGVSSATVSRVNNCLQYGDGGYKKAISMLNCLSD